MTTFPSIVPSTRLYVQGNFPNQIQESLSGNTTGFRRGNRRTEQTLTLGYKNLTETQVNQIRTHFDNQNGSFEIFFLSSEVWNDYTTPPVALISDFGWIYKSPPNITDAFFGRWDVDLTLETVPIDIGGVVYDAGDSSATARSYIIDALTSSNLPARTNIIDSGTSAS